MNDNNNNNNNDRHEHKKKGLPQQYNESINFAIQGMIENAQFAIAIAVGAIEWLLLMAQKICAIAKKYGSRISTNIS
jgi:hypothetical protein